MKRWPNWIYALAVLFLIVNPVLTYLSLWTTVGMKILWSIGAFAMDLAIIGSIHMEGDGTNDYDQVAGIEGGFLVLGWLVASFVNAAFIALYLVVLLGLAPSWFFILLILHCVVRFAILVAIPFLYDFLASYYED